MIPLFALAAAIATAAPDTLYACGDDQVRELRLTDRGAVEQWRWQASTATGLPDAYRHRLMDHIDDCKPVDDGRAVLVTSSTGGVVLLDRRTAKIRFYAKVPMAHSAALLPGGLVAVALSIERNGDRLNLYDMRRSDRVVQTLPLPSGHGAVWDAKRARLFTLSHDLVQAFRLTRGDAGGRLVETARWTLPGRRDGHDLSAARGGGYWVTTDDGVWNFDPDAGTFAAFAPLNPRLRVKSVSAMDDRIAWTQAEESWWAHGFTVMRSDGSEARRVPVEGMHLYKVRWVR